MKSPPFRDLLLALFRRLSLIDRNEKVCCGLTSSQCFTVEILFRKKQQTMKALSSELGVAVSTLTRVLDILVRDGIIERKPGDDDRRTVWVRLSEKGEKLAVQLEQCTDSYCGAILQKIPPARQKEVVQSLELLLKSIDDINRGGCC